MSEPESRFVTAADVVRASARGCISREELVSTLRSWTYEPQYKMTGLADDWETRPNSFDAVEYAFIVGLIDQHDYEIIFQLVDGGDEQGR